MKKFFTCFFTLVMISFFANVALATQEDAPSLRCPEGWTTIFLKKNYDRISNSSLLICTKKFGDGSSTNEFKTHLLLEKGNEITRYNLTLNSGCTSSLQWPLLGAMSGLQVSLDGESELLKKVFVDIYYDTSDYSNSEIEDFILTLISAYENEDFERILTTYKRNPVIYLNIDVCTNLGQGKENFTFGPKYLINSWVIMPNQSISDCIRKFVNQLRTNAFLERLPHLEKPIKKLKLFEDDEVVS